jgi:hypothetical protein
MLFFIQLVENSSLGAGCKADDPAFAAAIACRPAQKQTYPRTGYSGACPLLNKRLSCVRVKTSRNAGLEVQATTIAFKPTPGIGESQWDGIVGKPTVSAGVSAVEAMG